MEKLSSYFKTSTRVYVFNQFLHVTIDTSLRSSEKS